MDKDDKNVGITRDQVKYSLWTRFQMRVTEAEIDLLFKKYDKDNTGLLPLHPFVEGIYIHTYIHTHLYVYLHMLNVILCTCTNTFTHIHTYTHIYTHIQA